MFKTSTMYYMSTWRANWSRSVLRPGPMHVDYLVPENQMKARMSTEILSKYSMEPWDMNQWKTLERHSRTSIYRKTDLWVSAVPARSLPACWLGVYQPAAELARNLPTCNPLCLEQNIESKNQIRTKNTRWSTNGTTKHKEARFVMHLPRTAFKFENYFRHLKLQNLRGI
jgi:hypothetical protein